MLFSAGQWRNSILSVATVDRFRTDVMHRSISARHIYGGRHRQGHGGHTGLEMMQRAAECRRDKTICVLALGIRSRHGGPTRSLRRGNVELIVRCDKTSLCAEPQNDVSQDKST